VGEGLAGEGVGVVVDAGDLHADGCSGKGGRAGGRGGVSVTRKLTLAGRQSGRRPRASGRQLDNGGSNGCGTRARESARSPLHSSGRPDRCEWQNGGNAERHMGRCLWDGSPWGVHNFVDAPPTCPELVGVPGLPDVCGTPTGAAKVWDSHDHRKSVGVPRPPQKACACAGRGTHGWQSRTTRW
jgi:hypothetical protein